MVYRRSDRVGYCDFHSDHRQKRDVVNLANAPLAPIHPLPDKCGAQPTRLTSLKPLLRREPDLDVMVMALVRRVDCAPPNFSPVRHGFPTLRPQSAGDTSTEPEASPSAGEPPDRFSLGSKLPALVPA